MSTKNKPKGMSKLPHIPAEKINAARQMLINTTKSVKQVAKELGISTAVIYYHTGGKRQLLAQKAAWLAEKAKDVSKAGSRARHAAKKRAAAQAAA